jgi:hypothetical protein
VVNPKSAKSLSDIECHTCSDVNCDSYKESSERNRLSFNPVVLAAANVEIISDSLVNGAEKVTLSYEIILGNPLVENG